MIDAIAAGRPVKAQDDPNALNPDGQLLQRREREMAERLYEELQALVKSLFKGLSAAQVAIILSRLDDPEYGKPLRDALIAELQTTATAGVNHGWVQIEALSAILDEAAWATSNTAAAEWATTYGYSLIRGLTDTTRPLIAAEVRRFIDNSMTMNQLRDRLMESAMFGRVRAERIAVTEVTRAFAEGNMAAWRASKVVEAREWMTATDEIVCPICAPLRGQIAKMGEPFGGRIMNPPAHVNCILPGNNVVMPGRLSAAAQSFYVGKAIEIATRSGRVLTITENHPILTPVGYVAAGALREGGYVISATDPNRIAAAINPDDDHVPTAIEEVFRSLKESPFVVSHAMPATAEDFHGDGRAIDGDVDIVYIDRLLESDGVAALPEEIGQFNFSGDGVAFGALPALRHSDFHIMRDRTPAYCVMCGTDLLPPLALRHERPFEGFGLGLIAEGSPGLNQPLPYRPTVDPQTVSNGLFRFTGQITGDNLARRQLDPLPNSVLIDPGRVHDSSDNLIRHAFLAGQFIDRFSGLIAPDEIVSIRKFDFSGHVYDLQVDDYELYITKGIVTSNCRCWILPVVIDDPAAVLRP